MPAVSTGPSPVERIGALARAEPEQVIALREGTAVAAVWSHAPVQTEVCGLPQHALVLHLSGSTLVEKWRDGRLVGHRSRIGSVSLVPAVVRSGWVLSGHSRVAHLYVDPRSLAMLAESADGPPSKPMLGDFFAQDDDVAAALIRLVLAQARAGTFDELAHDEVMAMLLRHLLRRHSADRPLGPASQQLTLTRGGCSRTSKQGWATGCAWPNWLRWRICPTIIFCARFALQSARHPTSTCLPDASSARSNCSSAPRCRSSR
jgi:hypothetical protein